MFRLSDFKKFTKHKMLGIRKEHPLFATASWVRFRKKPKTMGPRVSIVPFGKTNLSFCAFYIGAWIFQRMIGGAYTPSFRIKQHPLEDAGEISFF